MEKRCFPIPINTQDLDGRRGSKVDDNVEEWLGSYLLSLLYYCYAYVTV